MAQQREARQQQEPGARLGHKNHVTPHRQSPEELQRAPVLFMWEQ